MQLPGKVSKRSAVNRGVRLSTCSYRRVPGWPEGICRAPEVSQAAVRVTVMAAGPARSESSHTLDFPLVMSAPPML